MSSEINKLLCAILTAILFFLLASFIGDLVYHTDEKKEISLSYKIGTEKVDDNIKEKLEITEPLINLNDIEKLLSQANPEAGSKFAKKNCATCHNFDLPEQNKIGPSLALLFDRKIASVNEYKYSKSLKEKSESWNSENLYFFLEKPKEWAPGTKMAYKGIKNQDDLINLIKYIAVNTFSNEN